MDEPGNSYCKHVLHTRVFGAFLKFVLRLPHLRSLAADGQDCRVEAPGQVEEEQVGSTLQVAVAADPASRVRRVDDLGDVSLHVGEVGHEDPPAEEAQEDEQAEDVGAATFPINITTPTCTLAVSRKKKSNGVRKFCLALTGWVP